MLHGECSDCPREKIDLGLLHMSREAYTISKRALYAYNVFSFESLDALKHWIIKLSPDAQLSVQKIHLELQWVYGHIRDVRHPATWHHKDLLLWRRFLDEDFTVQLPNIKELHIDISVDGRITCWREVQGPDLTQMFLPLRRLRALKRGKLTVTFTELNSNLGCPLLNYDHDESEHSLATGVTFWDRKEVRRQWAEEIRDLIPK